jgi:hypothetical protein
MRPADYLKLAYREWKKGVGALGAAPLWSYGGSYPGEGAGRGAP